MNTSEYSGSQVETENLVRFEQQIARIPIGAILHSAQSEILAGFACELA